MSRIDRQGLLDFVERFGKDVYKDPPRCEALLRDLYPQSKREIFVLVSAVREGICSDLLQSTNDVPQQVVLSQLTLRLQNNLGFSEDLAHWAVETWGLALGRMKTADIRQNSPPANDQDQIVEAELVQEKNKKTPSIAGEEIFRHHARSLMRDDPKSKHNKAQLEILRTQLGISRRTAKTIIAQVLSEQFSSPPTQPSPPRTQDATYTTLFSFRTQGDGNLTYRPQNFCPACQYTWYPRGRDLSVCCPQCKSKNVQFEDVPSIPNSPKSSPSGGGYVIALVLISFAAGLIYLNSRTEKPLVNPPQAPSIIEELQPPQIEEQAPEFIVTDPVEESTQPAIESPPDLPLPQPHPIIPSETDSKPSTFRTWATVDGKYSGEAEFQKVIAGTVYLKRMDGSIIEISKTDLSIEDQQWIKDRARLSAYPE